MAAPNATVFRKLWPYRITIWLAMLAAVVFSIWRLEPSIPDAHGFSTPDAMEQLRFLASETRAVGSPHHQGAREFISAEFVKLGYDVQLQSGTFAGGPLVNIVARKSGSRPGNKAVMLAAHYDSVRAGPGASDDGAAVVALLQVAKVFSQRACRNDVIFCVTDGEELGLRGARLFVLEPHPWLANVGVVLNFDARGTSGPSIMFETSEGNGWLIDVYARNAPHPVCSSLSFDIYKLMDNDTDFTEFRDRGHLQGLNFAFIGDAENYHRASDDVAHLDPRSLRHHGMQALRIAQALAEMDLEHPPVTGNAVYFDFASIGVVRYPVGAAPWTAMLAAMTAVGAAQYAIRRRGATIGGILQAMAGLVMNLLVAVGVAWGMGRLAPGSQFQQNAKLATFCYAALAVLLSLTAMRILARRRTIELAVAGLLGWIAPAVATGFVLRGGSYLTAWPLMAASIGVLLAATPSIRRRPVVLSVMLILLAAGMVILLAPMIYLSFLGLGPGMGFVLVVPIVMVTWLLALQIRYPQDEEQPDATA